MYFIELLSNLAGLGRTLCLFDNFMLIYTLFIDFKI